MVFLVQNFKTPQHIETLTFLHVVLLKFKIIVKLQYWFKSEVNKCILQEGRVSGGTVCHQCSYPVTLVCFLNYKIVEKY